MGRGRMDHQGKTQAETTTTSRFKLMTNCLCIARAIIDKNMGKSEIKETKVNKKAEKVVHMDVDAITEKDEQKKKKGSRGAIQGGTRRAHVSELGERK